MSFPRRGEVFWGPGKRKFALFLLSQMIRETVIVVMLWLSRVLQKNRYSIPGGSFSYRRIFYAYKISSRFNFYY